MLLSLLSLFFACEPKEELVDCTMEFRYSATISLEDQAGNPISDAQISYTVDGVEGTYVDSWMEGEYAVGGEESGDFVVEIFAEVPMEDDPCCWEIGEATLEFTIEADECHVISDSFEPELEWSMVCADAEECG
jgi:hypothetical protein